jgi:ectoine hydroxylase-related dioxygenase (phytanoyl-CoA dioxygenase family)
MDDAIEEPLVRRINGELDDAIKEGVQGYSYGSSQRIRNLHHRYGGVKALWRHPNVMRLLQLIFEVPARPCQTLTYVFGSQQEAHQDTIHLTPFPQGYMCGVWVALEDVKPDSGELEVFPGTHRLPRVYIHGSGCEKVTDDDWADFGEKIVKRYRRMLDEGGFRSVTYRPKSGTVLVWHENLLHGGSVRKDTSLSRRSIVSHYFADGAIAFYDSTGLPGHME